MQAARSPAFRIPARPGHLAPELRVIFQGKYAIYYLASVDEFVVVRVLHASRDIASIAEEGGFTI